MASTWKLTFLFLFVMYVELQFSLFLASASIEEANGLLRWKASFDSQSQSKLSSWSLPQNATTSNQSAISACTWYGISCDSDGSVNRLNLSSSGMKGTLSNFPFSSLPNLAYFELSVNEFFGILPPEISQLSNLIYFDLSINQFSGKIPPEIGQLTNLENLHLIENQFNGSIPAEIGQLKSLIGIAMYGNRLDGSIPASLGNLSNLQYLYLYNNQLTGSLPPEMGNLASLVDVYLGSNFLTGPIPSTFGNLKSVQVLYMFDNLLTGPIPSELGNLSSLTGLSLQSNNLSGPIPKSLGNLTNLTILHLYNNQLSGPIPQELGNWKSLVDLQVSENQLNGTVPASIANLSNLKTLYLRDNKLSGLIPQEIGNINFTVLQLDTNQFTGPLPANICLHGSLVNFTANDNQLTGPIPRSFRNCTSLVRFRLDGNQVVGNISEDFGVYPNLVFMDLSNNKFYGDLSPNWGRCPKLSSLRIPGNNVTGNIPPEIGNSSQLQSLDLSSNNLAGEIPKEVGKLVSLVRVTLSNNQLSGRLPREFGSLTNLQYLDLSMNQLGRSIPGNFGNLLKLNHLNLSNNKFNQVIPTELGKLKQLSNLDLSYNLLTGEIPSEISQMQSLETLNLSQNSLSGVVPSSFDDMRGLVLVNISHNKLQGPVPDNKAFQDAPIDALQGNIGLCGSISGLEPCSSAVNKDNSRNVAFLIAFPILGAFLLVSALFIIFFLSRKRKKGRDTEESNPGNDRFFSASNFDGKIMYQEIIKATNNFDPSCCIGKGGFGSVYKANLPSIGIVAVKRIHQIDASERAFDKAFWNEIKALTEIRHRNIVKLHGFCSKGPNSLLVYEYIERGSLASILRKDEEAAELDWRKRVNVVKGVAYALSYMHHDQSIPIVHRDISSNNILLDFEFEAHVADFGNAKHLRLDSSNWSAVAGTYGYVAPELAYTMKTTEKCDVYSFGVLALEVLRGKHPGDIIPSLISVSPNCRINLTDILDRRLPYPSVEDEIELIKILKLAIACLDANPLTRPKMNIISQEFSALSTVS